MLEGCKDKWAAAPYLIDDRTAAAAAELDIYLRLADRLFDKEALEEWWETRDEV